MGSAKRSFRLGSWLAFIALGLQIALSFGHIHPEGVRPAAVAHLSVSEFKQEKLQSLAAQTGDDEEYCAICAAIYLAANSFLPQAPRLAVPVVSQKAEHFDRIAAALIPPRRAPFQSRAPPQA